MQDIEVLVVPETDDFTHHVSHENIIWTNGNLGRPNIEGHNARYIAPYWLHQAVRGVTRIYHILDEPHANEDDSWEFTIGNSFLLSTPWLGLDESGQVRRFQYQKLSHFGLFELSEGLLTPMPPKLNTLEQNAILSGNSVEIPSKRRITSTNIEGVDYHYLYITEAEKKANAEAIRISRGELVEVLLGK